MEPLNKIGTQRLSKCQALEHSISITTAESQDNLCHMEKQETKYFNVKCLLKLAKECDLDLKINGLKPLNTQKINIVENHKQRTQDRLR